MSSNVHRFPCAVPSPGLQRTPDAVTPCPRRTMVRPHGAGALGSNGVEVPRSWGCCCPCVAQKALKFNQSISLNIIKCDHSMEGFSLKITLLLVKNIHQLSEGQNRKILSFVLLLCFSVKQIYHFPVPDSY